MFSGTALKRLISLVCVIEYVPSNCFITRFRAAVSVLVGPCCPSLLNCIDVDVHTLVLLGKLMMVIMMMMMIRPHRKHAVQRCGLLLPIFCGFLSVCVSDITVSPATTA